MLYSLWRRSRRGRRGRSYQDRDEKNTDLPEVAHNASRVSPLNKSDGEKSKDGVELETKEIIRRKPIAQVQHLPVEIEAAGEYITELEASYKPPLHEVPTSPDFDSQQRRNKLEGESRIKIVEPKGPDILVTAQVPKLLTQASPTTIPDAGNQVPVSMDDELQWLESAEARRREQEAQIRERKAQVLAKKYRDVA